MRPAGEGRARCALQESEERGRGTADRGRVGPRPGRALRGLTDLRGHRFADRRNVARALDHGCPIFRTTAQVPWARATYAGDGYETCIVACGDTPGGYRQ